jgi:hypothetical protein
MIRVAVVHRRKSLGFVVALATSLDYIIEYHGGRTVSTCSKILLEKQIIQALL